MSVQNCDEFRERLEWCIEQRMFYEHNLHLHAEHCSMCVEVWEQQQTLDAVIQTWSRATPEIDFADAIVTAWQRGSSPSKEITRSEENREVRHGDSEKPAGPSIAQVQNNQPSPVSDHNKSTRDRSRPHSILVVVCTLLLMFAWSAGLFGPSQTPEQPIVKNPDHLVPDSKSSAEDKRPALQNSQAADNTPNDQQQDTIAIRGVLSQTGVAWRGLATQAIEDIEGAADFVPTLDQFAVLFRQDDPPPSVDESTEPNENEDEQPLLRQHWDRAVDRLIDAIPFGNGTFI